MYEKETTMRRIFSGLGLAGGLLLAWSLFATVASNHLFVETAQIFSAAL